MHRGVDGRDACGDCARRIVMQDPGRLGDFIKGRKEFVLEGAKISMVRDDTTLKPLSVANQLEEILREHGPTMEVTALCSKFIQKFHVSVANVVQMRPMDFIMQEKEKFAMIGASSVTLKEFESQEKAKVEGSSLRMARAKSPQVSAGRSSRGMEAERGSATMLRIWPKQTLVRVRGAAAPFSWSDSMWNLFGSVLR